MTVKGKIFPLRDKIIVADMNFSSEKTKHGIILRSDDGKEHGIKPRWGRVVFTGPEQLEIGVNEWVLVEHGRWSRGIKYETDEGKEIEIRLIDIDAIMLISDRNPNIPELIKHGTFTFDIAQAE